MRAVGGGVRSPLWMQILADVTGYPCGRFPRGARQPRERARWRPWGWGGRKRRSCLPGLRV